MSNVSECSGGGSNPGNGTSLELRSDIVGADSSESAQPPPSCETSTSLEEVRCENEADVESGGQQCRETPTSSRVKCRNGPVGERAELCCDDKSTLFFIYI